MTGSHALAHDLCSTKEISFIGQYGKYKSPLLKSWSEASGNFTKLEIVANKKFLRVDFSLNQNGQTVSLPLKNNQTANFNFISYIHEQKNRPTQLTIKVLKTDHTIECVEEMTLIEKDDMNGVLKKP
jgi:hypothetical protein